MLQRPTLQQQHEHAKHVKVAEAAISKAELEARTINTRYCRKAETAETPDQAFDVAKGISRKIDQYISGTAGVRGKQ